jgi:hypothetical protein
MEVQERTEASQLPVYPWITTKEYRHRFGYLDYGAAAGPYFSVRSEKSSDCITREVSYSTDQYLVPPEVAEAGSVELTAVIHPAARSNLRTWAFMLKNHAERYSERHPEQWPLESGGEATLRQIGELLEHAVRSTQIAKQLEALELDRQDLELQPDAPALERQHLEDRMDAHLHEEIHRLEEKLDPLVRPEARRLQGKMTEAINRMLALVFDLAG